MFRPQTGRELAEFFNGICKKWDNLSPEEKMTGDWINPDEPVVLIVPNPEWEEGEDGPYMPDDDGNDLHCYYHVESHGGGGDVDEDGNECGHNGAQISGMEIEQPKYLYNGRRYEK